MTFLVIIGIPVAVITTIAVVTGAFSGCFVHPFDALSALASITCPF